MSGSLHLLGNAPAAILRSNSEARPCRVRPGVLLSGEKLIDDIDYRDQFVKLEVEAIGGEMEGLSIRSSYPRSRPSSLAIALTPVLSVRSFRFATRATMPH